MLTFWIKVVLVAGVLCATSACNSYDQTKHFHLHTYECDEFEKESMGVWFTRNVENANSGKHVGDKEAGDKRSKRSVSEDKACTTFSIQYLEMRNSPVSTINPQRVAGAFIYRYYTQREKVFWGIRNVVEAVKNKKTLNIVMDQGINFFVLTLQSKNFTAPEEVKLVSSEELAASDIIPKGYFIAKCENIFHYMSKLTGGYNGYSVTLTDLRNSNQEYRFYELTKGIGGFFST